MKRANWCWRSRLLLEGTFWSGMISLAFGIDESEFGAEALLLARAVITDWRIAKVIRLSQPPRGELALMRLTPLQLDQPWARDAFSVTAARIRAFNASSSIFSPSWKSMARLVLPSRLELKRPDGSSSAAPLEKVIFTTFLYVSPVQINPS